MRRRFFLRCTLVLLGFLILTLLDRELWRLLTIDPQKHMERKDWWQLFRQFGALPFWIILGVMFILHDAWAKVRDASRRGLLLILAPALGGGLAELMKGIIQRSRPGSDGVYRFGWLEEVHGFGLASSHVGVAFGGAIMLGWLFPPLRVAALLIATMTMLTRLLVGAHFTTDAYAAIVLAYAGCVLLWKVSPARGGEGG